MMNKLFLLILLASFVSGPLAKEDVLKNQLNVNDIAHSLNQQAKMPTLSEALKSNHDSESDKTTNVSDSHKNYHNLVEIPMSDDEKNIAPEEPFDMQSEIKKIKAFHLNHKPRAKLITNNISALEKSGHFIKALEKAKILYQRDPYNSLNINSLSRLLIKNNQPEKAIELLQPLTTESNSNWRPWFWLGTAYLLTKDYKNAEFYLDEALSREGNDSAIWIQRAIVEQQKGNAETATHFLQVANNLMPNNPEVLVNFAYASEKSGHIEKSIRAYKQFLQTSASQKSFGRLRSQVMLRIGQIEQAKNKPVQKKLEIIDSGMN